jgi:hypothetical protein
MECQRRYRTAGWDPPLETHMRAKPLVKNQTKFVLLWSEGLVCPLYRQDGRVLYEGKMFWKAHLKPGVGEPVESLQLVAPQRASCQEVRLRLQLKGGAACTLLRR